MISALVTSLALAAAPSSTPESLSVPVIEGTPAGSPTPPVRAEASPSLENAERQEPKPSFKLPEVVVTGEGEPLTPSRQEVTMPANVTKYLKAVAPASQVSLVLPSLLSGQKGVPSLNRPEGRKHVLELTGDGFLYNPSEATGSNRIAEEASHQTERIGGIRLGQAFPSFNYLLDYRRAWRDGWLENGLRDVSALAAPSVTPVYPDLVPQIRRRMRDSENDLKADVGIPFEGVRELRLGAAWKEEVLRLAYDPNPYSHLVKRRIGGSAVWQAQGTEQAGFAGSFHGDWTRFAEPPRDGSSGLPHEISDTRGDLDLRWKYPTSRFLETPWKERDESTLRFGVQYSSLDGLLPPSASWLSRVSPSGLGVVDPTTHQFIGLQSMLGFRADAMERIPGDGTEVAFGLRAVEMVGFKTPSLLLLPVAKASATLGTRATVYGSFTPDLGAENLSTAIFDQSAIRAYHEAPAPFRSLSEKIGVKLRLTDAFRADLSGFREDRSGISLWDNPLYVDSPAFAEWRYQLRNIYSPWAKTGGEAILEFTLASRLTQFLRYTITQAAFDDARLHYRTTFLPKNKAELGVRYEPGAQEPWKFEIAVRYSDSVFYTVDPPARSNGALDSTYPASIPPWATLVYSASHDLADWASLGIEGEHLIYGKYGDYMPSLYGYHGPHFRVGITGTLRF